MILSSDLDRRPRKFPCKDGAACKFLSLPLGCRLVFAAATDLFIVYQQIKTCDGEKSKF